MRIHVVAPEGFDNPGQPTGGNIYDRRVCAGLAEAGWDVLVTTVAGAWPVVVARDEHGAEVYERQLCRYVRAAGMRRLALAARMAAATSVGDSIVAAARRISAS